MKLGEQIYLWRHKNQLTDLHRVAWVYVVVLLVWGLYRMLFRLPTWFEETVLKAIVFGGPVFYLVLLKEKKQLTEMGMTTRGLLASVYLGLFSGACLAILGNLAWLLKTGGFFLGAELNVAEFGSVMMLGLVTAFWEQLLFAGYILPKLVKDFGSEWLGVGVMALLFAGIYLPGQIVEGAAASLLVPRLVLLFSLAVANGILFLRFKNLAAPVFAHLAWGITIYLFS